MCLALVISPTEQHIQPFAHSSHLKEMLLQPLNIGWKLSVWRRRFSDITWCRYYILQNFPTKTLSFTTNELPCSIWALLCCVFIVGLASFTLQHFSVQCGKRNSNMCEICSKFSMETPERLQLSHIVLVFLLVTLNK